MTPADVVQCPYNIVDKGALDVAARLARVGPLRLASVALVMRIHREGLTAAELVDLGADLTEAEEELSDHMDAVKTVVRRCVNLPPVPSRTLPPGF